MIYAIGSVWKTQLFPQNPKVVRVVVLPWEGKAPLNAKRLNRVALATADGEPNSANFWRSDAELFPLDSADADCVVWPPKGKPCRRRES